MIASKFAYDNDAIIKVKSIPDIVEYLGKNNASKPRIWYFNVNGVTRKVLEVPYWWAMEYKSRKEYLLILMPLLKKMGIDYKKMISMVGCSGINKYSDAGFQAILNYLRPWTKNGFILNGATGFGPDLSSIEKLAKENPKLSRKEVIDLAIKSKVSSAYDVNYGITALLEEAHKAKKSCAFSVAQTVQDGSLMVINRFGACVSPYIENMIVFTGVNSKEKMTQFTKECRWVDSTAPAQITFGNDIAIDMLARVFVVFDGGYQSLLQATLAWFRGSEINLFVNVRHRCNQGYFSAAAFIDEFAGWTSKLDINEGNVQTKFDDFVKTFYESLLKFPTKKYDGNTKSWQKKGAFSAIRWAITPEKIRSECLDFLQKTPGHVHMSPEELGKSFKEPFYTDLFRGIKYITDYGGNLSLTLKDLLPAVKVIAKFKFDPKTETATRVK